MMRKYGTVIWPDWKEDTKQRDMNRKQDVWWSTDKIITSLHVVQSTLQSISSLKPDNTNMVTLINSCLQVGCYPRFHKGVKKKEKKKVYLFVKRNMKICNKNREYNHETGSQKRQIAHQSLTTTNDARTWCTTTPSYSHSSLPYPLPVLFNSDRGFGRSLAEKRILVHFEVKRTRFSKYRTTPQTLRCFVNFNI